MSLTAFKFYSNQNKKLSMSHFLVIQVLKLELLLEVKVEVMVDMDMGAIVEAMVEAILSQIATIPTMANNLEKG